MSSRAKTRKPGVTRGHVETWAARYESGETLANIAVDTPYTPSGLGLLLRREGFELRKKGPREGRYRPGWTGGRCVKPNGYVVVRVYEDDPLYCMADVDGYAAEHRIVVARSLGRPLTSDESVHHINGDKSDNRLNNLQLLRANHAAGVGLTCRDCGSDNIKYTKIEEVTSAH